MTKTIASIVALSLVLSFSIALAQDPEEVTVTASVDTAEVGLSVTDGSIDYGVMLFSDVVPNIQDTQALSDTQTVTNDGGTIPIDISVKSSDMISDENPSVDDWELVSTGVALNQYQSAYNVTGDTVSWALFNDADVYEVDVVTDLGVSASFPLDLSLEMPTEGSNLGEHTQTITIMGSSAF